MYIYVYSISILGKILLKDVCIFIKEGRMVNQKRKKSKRKRKKETIYEKGENY